GVRPQTRCGSRDTQRIFRPPALGGPYRVLTQCPAKRHPHLGTPPPGHRCGMGAEGIAHGERRPAIAAAAETSLQHMMLVFMDLATGYLLMEEVSSDRCFETRYGGVNERLTTFGTEVLYVVSDRAKALVKLAHTGLSCLSIPDLFHLSHDLA